jgi:hypothetical protein
MLLLGVVLPPGAGAYRTDKLIAAPEEYNSFRPADPAHPAFPARGDTYLDSTFNETVRRLTDQTGSARTDGSDIYSKNGFFSANGTRMFHRSANGKLNIINVNTSAVVCSNILGVDLPFDSSFDPVNTNTWYFFSGTQLRSFNLETCQDAGLVKDFAPRRLGKLGGSVDWIDASGRYMVLNLDGQVHVWDKLDDRLYARTFSLDEYATCGDGWVGISPDGKYVITAGDTRDPATCNDDPPPPGPFDPTHYSFEILHGANPPTLGDPVLFWTLTGGHADVVSASDGKTYFVATDSTITGDIFRVDVTKPQDPDTAHTEDGWHKQVADHWPPIANLDNPDGEWLDSDGHLSGVSKGSLRDWVYVSVESTDDPFRPHDEIDTGTWRRYKQEIFMVNVLSREARRLAHHRSRGLGGNSPYNYQPRVSASWDGGRVAWASNFNVSTLDSEEVGYSDIYAITVPVPTVSVTSPANDATVKGTQTVIASVNAGIVAVQFKVDGVNLGAEDTSAPYLVSWDTRSLTPGSSHTLTAVARNAAGVLTTSSPVSVTISSDSTPPTISITAPANGATVSGTLTVTATAADNVGVEGVQFKVNGQNLGAEDLTAPWARSWNTANNGDGTYMLTAVARDAAGNVTTSSAISVVVDHNDPTPPTISITAPANGATVSGSLTVTATATDNVGVVGVQFKLNGQNLGGEDQAAPWARTWNTVNTANGPHTLTAVARDAAGNITTSTSVLVTVSNGP